MPVRGAARRPTRIAGIAAVAVAIGGSRWGSYLPRNPLFFTDIFLGAALVYLVLRAKPPVAAEQADVRPPNLVFKLLVGWAVVRLLFAEHYSMTALRDFAPYFYAVAGLLGAYALRWADGAARRYTVTVLRAALAFHAAWFFVVATFGRSLPFALPATQGGHLFEIRSDIDTAVTGVFVALLVVQLIKGRIVHRRLTVIAIGLSVVAILYTGSRAGLIGAVVVNVFALVAVLFDQHGRAKRQLGLFALIPILVLVGGASLSQTRIGDRLLGTFGITGTSEAALGAEATTHARDNAWHALYQWITQDTRTTAIGVGFGPNFMTESDAALQLVGTDDPDGTTPRSPHNYWLGTFAREGLVGLALFVWLSLLVLTRAWRIATHVAGDDLLFLAAAIPLCLFVPLSLGVIMESPFGAVPFFWCAGILLASPRSRSEPSATSGAGAVPTQLAG